MTTASRGLLSAMVASWLSAMPAVAAYPEKPITLVIGFAPGGPSDVMARILTKRMEEILKQPVVVENRAGAGGGIAAMAVARAAPDGYTILLATGSSLAINVSLYKNLGYDPEKDLEMISPFAGFTIIVAVSKTLPPRTLKDFIEYAKANPGLNFGSVGNGSSQHLAGEYFSQVTGVKMTHVPYRNIAQYGPDLIAGTVPLGFQWYPNIAGPLQAKGAIPLAVAGDKRIPTLPDVPTTTEAGLPQYKVNGWFALLAPAGTPKPILERINKEMMAALNDPQVKQGFESAGAEVMMMPLDESKKFLHEEIIKYRDIITKAGIPKID